MIELSGGAEKALKKARSYFNTDKLKWALLFCDAIMSHHNINGDNLTETLATEAKVSIAMFESQKMGCVVLFLHLRLYICFKFMFLTIFLSR